jgi:hypothetical protein
MLLGTAGSLRKVPLPKCQVLVPPDDFLLGHMAKQCKVARADFLDLVDCPMDRAAYEAKLAAQGIGLTEKAG